MKLLAADFGGTNARLAVVEVEGESTRVLRVEAYRCDEFSGPDDVLERFAEAAPERERVVGGCLALAGPVGAGAKEARLTHRPWTIKAERASRRFGGVPVVLANDFEAAARSVPAFGRDDLSVLQPGEFDSRAARVVLGPGTGLGVATLLPEAGGWRVLPGEGGHLGFAPRGAEQAALHAWLEHRVGRVEVEHLLSGPGLARIYDFCRETPGGHAQEPDPHAEADPASAIARLAAERRSVAAMRAVALFGAVLGAFAGDLALMLNARGGVYLAGGMVPAMLSQLVAGPWREAFLDKGVHRVLVEKVPVTVVTHPWPGVIGAALLGRDRLHR